MPLFILWRDSLSLPTCEKKRLINILSKDWLFLGDVLPDWRPFSLYFPMASPSLFCLLTLVPHCFWCIKELNIQTPVRCLFWGTSLPPFSVCQLRLNLSLTSTLVSSNALVYGVASRVSLISASLGTSQPISGQQDTSCPVCSVVGVLYLSVLYLISSLTLCTKQMDHFLILSAPHFSIFKKATTRYSIGWICPELFHLCIDSHVGCFKHFAV